MKIQNLSISLIKPYEKNAKLHPDVQIQNVAESIRQFGWQQPIVVDKDYVIIIGHCRYMAAQRLGYTEVPVVVADSLTEDQVTKLRIVDNKSNESDWDLDLLKDDIGDLDFAGFDFDFGFKEPPADVKDDDFDIDAAKPLIPNAQEGNIYLLGRHRLMCGSSTDDVAVSRLMDGKLADLLFTDPPYNVNIENSDGLQIENDNLTNDAFVQLLDGAFRLASANMKPGASFYCWYANREHINFETCLKNNDLPVKEQLIWVKNLFTFGRQDYKWQHEPCLYGWKEGAAHYFVEEFNHPTVIDDSDNLDINKMSKDELKKCLSDLIAKSTQTPTTIIHENKPLKNVLHPTMKPLTLCAGLIRNSSKPGDIVLDLFGGSGSTLMVCEELGRTCYMMELDPTYVDVIIARWESLTGKKATKYEKQ